MVFNSLEPVYNVKFLKQKACNKKISLVVYLKKKRLYKDFIFNSSSNLYCIYHHVDGTWEHLSEKQFNNSSVAKAIELKILYIS